MGRVVAVRLIELPFAAEIDAGRRRQAHFVAGTSAQAKDCRKYGDPHDEPLIDKGILY
jgi:hypothetical protein